MTGVRLSPYAQAMGIAVADGGGEPGAPVLTLAFTAEVEGRPGALHGGAIGGLLEAAGYAALDNALLAAGRRVRLKPINFTAQYLSPARVATSFARGRVVRLGRRTAHLTVEVWQADPARPVATAVMNVLLAPMTRAAI